MPDHTIPKIFTVRLTHPEGDVSLHRASELEDAKQYVHNLGGRLEVHTGSGWVEIRRAEARVTLTFAHHEDAERFIFVLNQLIHNACGKRSISTSLRRLARLAVVILQKL